MASNQTHAVRNGVIGTVVGGVFLAALGELWPPLRVMLFWVWERVLFVVGLLGDSYSLPGWALVVLFLLVLISSTHAINWIRGSPQVSYSGYVEDMVFGLKWRWTWFNESLVDMWCYCPVCDAELVYDDSAAQSVYSMERPKTIFICEHCSHSTMGSIDGGGKDYALGAVRREIHRRVRTGEFPQKLNKA